MVPPERPSTPNRGFYPGKKRRESSFNSQSITRLPAQPRRRDSEPVARLATLPSAPSPTAPPASAPPPAPPLAAGTVPSASVNGYDAQSYRQAPPPAASPPAGAVVNGYGPEDAVDGYATIRTANGYVPNGDAKGYVPSAGANGYAPSGGASGQVPPPPQPVHNGFPPPAGAVGFVPKGGASGFVPEGGASGLVPPGAAAGVVSSDANGYAAAHSRAAPVGGYPARDVTSGVLGKRMADGAPSGEPAAVRQPGRNGEVLHLQRRFLAHMFDLFRHLCQKCDGDEIAEFSAFVSAIVNGREVARDEEIRRCQESLEKYARRFKEKVAVSVDPPAYIASTRQQIVELWRTRFSRSTKESLRYQQPQNELERLARQEKKTRDERAKSRGRSATPARGSLGAPRTPAHSFDNLLSNVMMPPPIPLVDPSNAVPGIGSGGGFTRKGPAKVGGSPRAYGPPGQARFGQAVTATGVPPPPPRHRSTRPTPNIIDSDNGLSLCTLSESHEGGLGMFKYYPDPDQSTLPSDLKEMDERQKSFLINFLRNQSRFRQRFEREVVRLSLPLLETQAVEFLEECASDNAGGILTNAGSETGRDAILLWISSYVHNSYMLKTPYVGSQALLVVPEADLLKWDENIQAPRCAYSKDFMLKRLPLDTVEKNVDLALEIIGDWMGGRGLIMISLEALQGLFEISKRNSKVKPIFEDAFQNPGPAVAFITGAHKLRHLSLRFLQKLNMMKTKSRFAVTAAPVSGNNLFEFHAMADWAVPGALCSLDAFRDLFVSPIVSKFSLPPCDADSTLARNAAGLLVNRIKMISCTLSEPSFLNVHSHIIVRLNMTSTHGRFYCRVMDVILKALQDNDVDPAVAATFAQVASSDVGALLNLSESLISLHSRRRVFSETSRPHPAVESLLRTGGAVAPSLSALAVSTLKDAGSPVSCKLDALIAIYQGCLVKGNPMIVFCATRETRDSLCKSFRSWFEGAHPERLRDSINLWDVDVTSSVEGRLAPRLRKSRGVLFSTVTPDSCHWEATGEVIAGVGNLVIVMADCPWSIATDAQVHSRVIWTEENEKPIVISLVTRMTVEDEWDKMHTALQSVTDPNRKHINDRDGILCDPEIDIDVLRPPRGGLPEIDKVRESEFPDMSSSNIGSDPIISQLLHRGQLLNDILLPRVDLPKYLNMVPRESYSRFVWVKSQLDRPVIGAFQTHELTSGKTTGKSKLLKACRELSHRTDQLTASGDRFFAQEDLLDLNKFLLPELSDPRNRTLFECMRPHWDLYGFARLTLSGMTPPMTQVHDPDAGGRGNRTVPHGAPQSGGHFSEAPQNGWNHGPDAGGRANGKMSLGAQQPSWTKHSGTPLGRGPPQGRPSTPRRGGLQGRRAPQGRGVLQGRGAPQDHGAPQDRVGLQGHGTPRGRGGQGGHGRLAGHPSTPRRVAQPGRPSSPRHTLTRGGPGLKVSQGRGDPQTHRNFAFHDDRSEGWR